MLNLNNVHQHVVSPSDMNNAISFSPIQIYFWSLRRETGNRNLLVINNALCIETSIPYITCKM